MRILAFLIATSAWGQITSIPGLVNPSGGAIGGASAVATGQVLYGTGAGVAGSKNTFVFDPAVDRLNFGSAVRANGQVLNMYELGNIRYGIGVATSALRFYNPGSGNQTVFGTVSTADGSTFTEQMRLVGGTGNLLLGTTTDDGTNRLQVAGNIRVTGTNYQFFGDDGTVAVRSSNATGGSLQLFAAGQAMQTISNAGTITLLNPTPTLGVTQLVVRAGAGQGSTNLTTWQNAAGAQVAAIGSTGIVSAPALINSTASAGIASNISVGTGSLFSFSSTTQYFGTADLALARNAAGVLEVNNGTAGTFRDLALRGVRAVGVTVANLPPASGNAGMRATVTDANATTIGTTVAGGGANTVLVWSNGTNWRIYAN